MFKRSKFFIVFMLMVFLGGQVSGKKIDDSPEYTQYASEVTNAFVKEMYKKYGLECGACGGSMPWDVEKISVSLHSDRSATIEQARELEVRATERFVQIINAHEKIRPFLREYPFPPGRARVMIAFYPKKRFFSPAIKSDVELVSHVKNKIFYEVKTVEHPHLFKEIMKEPYEEALKIVQNKIAQDAVKKPKDH